MKRFLMLVGVAAVAAAMYVAASPASQQSKGPSEKQFLALQKKVNTLSKTLKNTTLVADAALGVIGDCYLTISGNNANANGLGVSQLGSTNGSGFLFGPNGGPGSPTTALDAVTSGPQHYLQEVTPACVAGNLLRHGAAHLAGIQLQHLAERSH